MLQRLAGRLKWDQTGSGIHVEIPARLNWTSLFLIVWLIGWTIGGRHVLSETFTPGSKSYHSLFNLLWLVAWAFGEVLVGATLIWSLTGRTTVDLDPSMLKIRRFALGVQIDRRSFPTSDVRNLRFSPPAQRGRNYAQSQIKSEVQDKTLGIGSGIDDAEAFALIDKMLEVYRFPKERALEYLAISS